MLARTLSSLMLALTIGLSPLGAPARAAGGNEAEQCGKAVDVLLMDEKTKVTVVLGETTVQQARDVFPPAPWKEYEGNPRPATPGSAPHFYTRKKPVTVYNPWMSMNALYFDDNNRLIMLVTLGATPDGKTRLEEADLKRMGLSKASKEGGVIYYHGQFGECSTFDVGVDPSRRGEVEGSAWSFTCETKPDKR